jgi:tripartite-type tricarboxylate transporter receptor subunit TctC
MIRRRSLLAVPAAAALASARPAGAQEAWPNRPLRMICPFAAGTTTDILARLVAAELSRGLGQPVVVDNRAGAGGNIGAAAVANAAPDGYTILLGTNGTHGINASLFADPGFDPVKSFTPVAATVATSVVLAVPPSLGVNSVAEFVALARKRPLTIASAGNGTTGHLSQALVNMRGGVETSHIPYRNGGQGVTDLIAGRVDSMFYHPIALKPHLEAGTIKGLAVTGAKRVGMLPDLPTMQEAGLADFVVEAWWAVYAPARLPPEMAQRMAAIIAAWQAAPATLGTLREQGVDPLPAGPAQLARMTSDEVAKWRPIVAAANIRPD